MSEAEWLRCTSPESLLWGVITTLTPRKMQLFAIACGAAVLSEHPSPQEASRALALAESVAEGVAAEWQREETWQEFRRRADLMSYPGCERPEEVVNYALCPNAAEAAMAACRLLVLARGGKWRESSEEWWWVDVPEDLAPDLEPRVVGAASAPTAELLREVVGNPFRPVTFALSWRTDTTLTLARQMYESRDFSAMPILADALQDAGCDNADILNHCRGPGPHVRGCWVVDSVLDKE
jgi:hypothetical protein